MSDNNDFNLDTNYTTNSAFTRVKFGVNRPILEVELNEQQKISEERATNFIRQNVPTGFLELVRKDFVGTPIIYNPNGLNNAIAIAPSKMSLNGYTVIVEGNDTINGIDGYTIITLSEAPTTSPFFYDFVYLEIWFEELGSTDTIYKNGFVNGQVLPNSIVDSRVGDETSRRVGIRYKFSLKNGIDFKKWPEGFGFNNLSDYSDVYASGPRNSSIVDPKYLFINGVSDDFRNTTFYGDNGLYVAGRPDYPNLNGDFGVLENYIFAIPVMSIKRRNKTEYSQNNANGSTKYISEDTVSSRPDGLFYNKIDARDVTDFRKTISLGQFNATRMLDENLKGLMNGSLKSNKKESVVRTQFGIKTIDSFSNTDYNNAVFHTKFNKSLIPTLPGLDNAITTKVPNWHLSASGYGLSLDGKFEVKYPLEGFEETQLFNHLEGTLDFFLRPYWNGIDQDISQTILTITDELGFPLMELSKDKGQLLMKLSSNPDAPQTNNTIAYLDQYPIYNNEVYHIRFTWAANADESKIYINGALAATNIYTPSMPSTKHYLVIGKDGELINSHSPDFIGCVIDELVIYNKVLENKFVQFNSDIATGDAKIHPSFNGVLTGFKNNTNKQVVVSSVPTVLNTDSITVEIPYGLIIDSTSVFTVYNPADGSIYSGQPPQFNGNTAIFKLAAGAKFVGEIVWVVHTVIVPGGYGIQDIPTRILKATINGEEMSFASTMEVKRPVLLVNPDGSVEKKHKAYDYNSNRNNVSAYARTIDYVMPSNGTNIYILPDTIYGKQVIGIKSVDKSLSKIAKRSDGSFEITLIKELKFGESLVVTTALDGYTFEYETYTKSPIANIMRAATIKIPTSGNKKNYKISTELAIPGANKANPSGGIIAAFLGLEGYDASYQKVSFGTSVFITGSQFNYYAAATVTGVGTPIINIDFENTPQTGHFIEIPVLVTYQPRVTDLISLWYEYIPYQGTLRQDSQKKLKRLTSWKIFCTTLGSGQIVVNKINDKSINNASNRLPGGQAYSYLLDSSDIEFVGEQLTIPTGYNENYHPNKKLVFRNQFTELVFDNEYDDLMDSLNAEFTIAKSFGQNHQDANISSEISKMNFIIQDTKYAMNKYIGAACLVVDEEGNIMLLVVGEINTVKTNASVMRPTYGDLFKLNGNPMVIARRY